MMALDSSPLPTSIVRGLTDKLVERRKGAALELERMVKDLVMINDYSQIKQVVSALVHDFTLSSSANSRKGGLVGLAATAIALGRPSIGMHLPELVQPVLTCFDDPDARVRYYACESLYNISKVARGAVLVFFNSAFEGLCKLSSDSDSNVRYGAELLDRLMKDIVSENPHFDIDNFILLLRDRIYTQDGFARQFLVTWISFLDSVPDIHMHEHVPEFIDGLFCILGDQRKEIRRMTEDALGELLREIERHSSSVRYEAMANILAIHCQSDDKCIQFTALMWMKTFLTLAQRSMMVFTSNILVSILPCVAYDNDKSHIRDVAVSVNDRLKKLITPEDDEDYVTDNLSSATNTPSTITNTTNTNTTTTPSESPILKRSSPLSQVTPGHTTSTITTTSSSLTPSPSSQSFPATNVETQNAAVTSDNHVDKDQSNHKSGQTVTKPIGQSPNTTRKIDSNTAVAVLNAENVDGGGKSESITESRLHLLAVLGVLIPHMKYTLPETRMETLRWLMWLHQQLPKRVYLQAGKLFPALLEMLTDQSDRVVCMALHAIAILSTSRACMDIPTITVNKQEATPTKTTPTKTTSTKTTPIKSMLKLTGSKSQPSTSDSASATKSTEGQKVMRLTPCPGNKYFRLFVVELVKMFDNDNKILLEKKGSFIIRQLCVYVDAHAVYCTLAEILDAEKNLTFACLVVQVLNQILFTSTELYGLRLQLQLLETPESWSLFTTLYRSWCHNPVATIALCLISQNYKHSSELVQKFVNIEITASTLKEIDKLVQLLESPIFSFLRLQLLDPGQHAGLVRTLYGLLMLLPQSTAFNTLRQRLDCVPPAVSVVQQGGKMSDSKTKRKTPSSVSFNELLQHFVAVQQRHSQMRRQTASHLYKNNTTGMIR